MLQTLWLPPTGFVNNCDGGRSHTYCDYRYILVILQCSRQFDTESFFSYLQPAVNSVFALFCSWTVGKNQNVSSIKCSALVLTSSLESQRPVNYSRVLRTYMLFRILQTKRKRVLG